MKKALFIIAACTVLAGPLSAQLFTSPLQNGRYACNGTAYTMSLTMLGASGMATLYDGGRILSSASVTVKDGTVVFTFNTGTEEYRGKSWFYSLDSAVSFSGNGETWMQISDGRYSPVKPGGGSITNPEGGGSFRLQSGVYTLSGSRQRMNITVNRAINRGHGTLWDDRGNVAGNFDLRINKDSLSVTFTNGRLTGITNDYRITGDTAFSRRGEMWLKRDR
ncbi:MAG: hypothetical protein LBL19_02955 [Spirochaetaceae bacterium]|jgi:hypothetical protein|nr:hypothetical protein [Spirochaetaceae bacterium]